MKSVFVHKQNDLNLHAERRTEVGVIGARSLSGTQLQYWSKTKRNPDIVLFLPFVWKFLCKIGLFLLDTVQ